MEQVRTLQRVVDSQTLRWIFVGGKGGVGKTTTSAALGLQLARRKEQVLIISTDPAHNLSDAFDQKFGSTPTPVAGTPNLFAMEISPKFDAEHIQLPEALALETDQATKDFISELVTSIPGIDEAMSFAELMKTVQGMNFSVIVFDTAPTGHTLRLLSFPSLLDRGLSRIVDLKQRFGSLFSQMSAMLGQTEGEGMYNSAFGRVEAMKTIITAVNTQIQDAVWLT